MQNPEKPISSVKDDTLGREGFIHRISNALITENQATGVVIGLTGKWGSGKSSTLNMLQEQVQKNHPEAAVVNFNPWLITDKHDLVNQFFAELITAIKESSCVRRLGNYQFDLPQELINYAGAISSIADNIAPGLGIITKSSAELLAKAISRDTSIYGLRQKIEYELKRVCYPIVVLIDELDRVEDEEVRRVAQLIKGIADFPNISYLVAYDEMRVIEALGGKAGCCNEGNDWNERGRNYIEKIIQYPIALPELNDSDLDEMMKSGLELILGGKASKDEEWNHTQNRLSRLLEITIPGLLNTPRDVKRALGHFQVIHGITGEEIDWVDVLACSVIQIKAPGTFNWLKQNSDKVTQTADGMSFLRLNNALESLFTEEERKEKTIIAIQENEHANPLRKLLQELFPVFSNSSTSSPTEHESPISNYHNFKLMLTHGITTGDIPKKIIDQFLKASTPERHETLTEFLSSEHKDDFLEAFSGRYPYRSSIDDISLWKDLASFLSNPKNVNNSHNIKPISISAAEHFEEILSLLTREGKKLYPIEKELIQALVSIGDYNIVPHILRHYIFSYGLFEKDARNNRTSMDIKNIENLSNSLSNQFKTALRSKKPEPLNFSAQMFYLAGDTSGWSADFKEIIEIHIEKDDNLIRLCILLFGENKGIERSFLIKIFDIEKLYDRLKKMRSANSMESSCETYKSKIVHDSIEKIKVALPQHTPQSIFDKVPS